MKDTSVMTDGELLAAYLDSGREDNIEEVIRRHSGMVLGVCRRVLAGDSEAEDVFQASFAMLLKHASRLRKTDWVGGWLYRVAYNGALKTAQKSRRRREHETMAGEMKMQMNAGNAGENWEQVKPVLDEELNRLPERLKAPLVLCFLENKPQEEAALVLGWSHGQLRGRLAKAKKVMQDRLKKRGIVLPSAVLFALIAERAAEAAVPQALCSSALNVSIGIASGGAAAAAAGNVAAIMKGMGNMLFWAKVKTAVVYVIVSMVCLLGAAAGAGIAGDSKSEKAEERMLFPICAEGKWGFIDARGKILVKPVYEEASASTEGFALVKQNGKYGYIHVSLDTSLEIKPQFEYACPFREGMARIKKGGEWEKHPYREGMRYTGGKVGFIDTKGDIAIKAQFTDAGDFSQGLAWFSNAAAFTQADVEKKIAEYKAEIAGNSDEKDPEQARKAIVLADKIRHLSGDGVKALPDRRGYINQKGEVVIQPVFTKAGDFSEGLAAATVQEYVLHRPIYGYIDRSGEFVIRPEQLKSTSAGSFENGRALVKIGYSESYKSRDGKNGNGISMKISEGHYAVIDRTGRVILDLGGYKTVGKPGKGLIPVSGIRKGRMTQGGKQNYIDYSGKTAVTTDSYDGRAFHDGLAVVRKSILEGRCGYVDRTGSVVIPFQFESAGDFENGLARVEFYKYGFINTRGEIAVPVIYDAVSPFSEGLAAVKKDGRYGFIDRNGSIEIPFLFEDVGYRDRSRAPFSEGLAPFRAGDRWGYINKKGSVEINPRFINAMPFSGGRAAVRMDYKSGLAYIDPRGTVLAQGVLIAHGLNTLFSEGYVFGATAYTKKNKNVIMDSMGNITGELPQGVYFHGKRISSGLCAVHRLQGKGVFGPKKAGFADIKGEIVIDLQFDDVLDFSEGLAAVKKDGLYGYINTAGAMVIKPRFTSVGDFSEGLAWFSDTETVSDRTSMAGSRRITTFNYGNKNSRYGYIDKKGNIIVTGHYEKATDFSEGFAAVCKDGEWFFIDRAGNEAFRFPEGLTFPEGHRTINPKPVFSVKNGLVPVEMKCIGYINTKGEFIWCSADSRPAPDAVSENKAFSKTVQQQAAGSGRGVSVPEQEFSEKQAVEDPIEARKAKLRLLFNGCVMYKLDHDTFPAKISDLYPDYVNNLSAYTVSGRIPGKEELESESDYTLPENSPTDNVLIKEKSGVSGDIRFSINSAGKILEEKK